MISRLIAPSDSELGKVGCGGYIKGDRDVLGLKWHGWCCDAVLLLPLCIFVLGFNRDS